MYGSGYLIQSCLHKSVLRPGAYCTIKRGSREIFGGNAPPQKSRLRVASAKGGRIEAPKSVGVWNGEGCSLFSRLGDLGERRKLPRGVRGGVPAGNAFWRTYYNSLYRMLLFCRCYEFVKQCFVSHLGTRSRYGAIAPFAPT